MRAITCWDSRKRIITGQRSPYPSTPPGKDGPRALRDICSIFRVSKWQQLTRVLSSVQFSCSVMSNSSQPMDCSMPGLLVHQQLPELAQTHVHRVGDAIQPSHPLLTRLKKKMLLTYYGFPVYCFLLIEELKVGKIYSLSLLVYI